MLCPALRMLLVVTVINEEVHYYCFGLSVVGRLQGFYKMGINVDFMVLLMVTALMKTTMTITMAMIMTVMTLKDVKHEKDNECGGC